jgi:copper chaperone CopZ
METAIRRLDGVANVSISMQTKLVEVTYAPNSRFQPAGIREAVSQVAVSVDQLMIVARGRMVMDGTKGYFVVGEDRYILDDLSSIPPGKLISITGIIDDSSSPFKLRIAQTRPAN